MAIFASTTTSNYSDPLKAMSIKALEKRLADQQAQMAQQPEAATMSTIPGGLGHVLGVVGDKMAQGRTEQAAAGQKEALARMIAQGPQGPNGEYSPQQLATWSVADPEGMKAAMATMAENRRAKAQNDTTRYGYDTTAATSRATNATTAAGQQLRADVDRETLGSQGAIATAKIEADKAAAAEAARVAQEAAAEQEKRLRERPQTDLEKLTQTLGRKPTEEEVNASISKLTAPSASEMKAGNEIQNTHLDTQSALNDLKEARALLGPEGTGIRAGTGAGFGQTAAKWIGDPLGVTGDPQLTQKTERYNQIMSSEAISAMAQKLKGASTDYEMKQFIALMNDPNTAPKTKMDTLNSMIAKAEAHAALQADQLKRAKVPVPAGPGGAAPATAAPAASTAPAKSPEDAAALDWASKNPDDPRAAKIRQRLGAP